MPERQDKTVCRCRRGIKSRCENNTRILTRIRIPVKEVQLKSIQGKNPLFPYSLSSIFTPEKLT